MDLTRRAQIVRACRLELKELTATRPYDKFGNPRNGAKLSPADSRRATSLRNFYEKPIADANYRDWHDADGKPKQRLMADTTKHPDGTVTTRMNRRGPDASESARMSQPMYLMDGIHRTPQRMLVSPAQRNKLAKRMGRQAALNNAAIANDPVLRAHFSAPRSTLGAGPKKRPVY